jgi:hypothetical protein
MAFNPFVRFVNLGASFSRLFISPTFFQGLQLSCGVSYHVQEWMLSHRVKLQVTAGDV